MPIEVWTLAALLLGALALLHFGYVMLLRIASRSSPPWVSDAIRAVRMPVAVLAWAFAARALTEKILLRLALPEAEALQLTSAVHWITRAVVVVFGLWLLLRLSRVIDFKLCSLAERTSSRIEAIVLRLAGHAIRVLLPLMSLLFVTSSLDIDASTRKVVWHIAAILVISCVAYLLFQLTAALQALVLARHPVDAANNYRARGIQTQVKLLGRVAGVLIGVLTLASILMVFESVRHFGRTILASAGVAGVVIGFAAQRSIATLLAGFQIAITQPIRLDDTVVVENEFGRVEEITLTYVVLALWDLRRLVVPITWFIEKPFQNWTRASTQIIGTVFIYMDYQVPLGALRAEFERIAKQSALWDRDICSMQVTGTKETCIEVRGLISASDAAKAWDLRCEAREKLVAWLSSAFPDALPRARVQLAPSRHQPNVP